jgi:signal transduction histidine kinase
VDVELRDAGDEVLLEVRDTGPGIPEQELPRIFERFYRGTNVGEARASGSGLGLAIARSIVEMHRGSIEVASVLGKGTRFRVHLPRLPETALAPPPAHARQSRIRGLRRPRATLREPAVERSRREP